MQIITNAPLYVWAILAAIVVFGLLQTRDRRISPAIVLILPIAMVAFSLLGLRSMFGGDLAPFAFWLAGAAIAVGGNHLILGQPRRVAYEAPAGRYNVPGSWVPLLVMLAIFVANYAINMMLVLRPEALRQTAVFASWSLLLGILGGFFVARAMQILRSKQAA